MRMLKASLESLAGLSVLLALPALAEPTAVRGDHSQAMLVSTGESASPGQALSVVLRLTHDDGWHSYWINPGDSGLATRLRWRLPDGWQAGELGWPTPVRFELDGIHNFGYGGAVGLPTMLKVPADAVPGETVTLQADARWLVCKDICVTEKASLALPVSIGAPASTATDPALRQSSDANLPRIAAVSEGRIESAGQTFDFLLSGLPASFTPGMRVEVFPRSTQWLSHRPLSAVVDERQQLEFVAARNDYFTRWPEQPVLLLKPEAGEQPAYELTLDLPPPDLTGDAP
ncbi:MAG: protein-disulfide reductase DsbD family protein [Lysobacteraceae bacterium]